MRGLELVAQAPQAEDRPPVPGFSGWWDASDPGSLQGGLGDRLAAWQDKSGFGRHLTQTTDANRPYTGSWTRNGRNVVWTTGKVSALRGTVPLTAVPWSVFLAAANTAADAVQRTLVSGFYSAGTEWGRVYRPTSNAIALYAGAVLASAQLWVRDRTRVVMGTFNGASSELRVDGRFITTGSVAGGGGNSVDQSLFGLGLSESWYGWVGEMITYDARTLTTSEIQRTESYLTRKWGIA
jgi:hypothetical protein